MTDLADEKRWEVFKTGSDWEDLFTIVKQACRQAAEHTNNLRIDHLENL